MKRQTQVILYHLLPAIFWLLAIIGSLVPVVIQHTAFGSPSSEFSIPENYYWGYLVAALVLFVILIISRIKRHSSSVEECFLSALLLGVASYWLPTVVFLVLPVWGYLIYQNLFGLRAFVASLIGFAVVAIWSAVFIWLGWLTNVWSGFFAAEQAWGWIPLGAILLAWLASLISQKVLQVR